MQVPRLARLLRIPPKPWAALFAGSLEMTNLQGKIGNLGIEKVLESDATSDRTIAVERNMPVKLTERPYRAREFADRAGVTVRALHHYDRLGLLKPSGRTAAGYRLYGESDLARLQQIVTLKFIGLSLTQIKDLLGNRSFELTTTLRLQHELLQEKRRQLDAALDAIERAEHAMRSGEPDWDALKKIVEVIEMQNVDWKKYYSDEAQAKLADRRAADPAAVTRGERDWAALIAEVEQAVREGVDPTSERAQALAARWQALIAGFTGGDREVEQGLKKFYANQANWPGTFKKPFSDEVGAFISRANEARKNK